MNKGVMTGDSLSPLLFILFISDLCDYMKSKDIQGIPIDREHNVIALLYADDLVLLSNKEEELQKMLNVLEEYCNLNKLEVNVEKTKIVVFRRKGKLRSNLKFHYRQIPVEIVPSYVYLGVIFTSGLCFSENVKKFINKTMGAISTVNSLWARTKTYNWEANKIVYNSVIKSILLYGAEVWGVRYLEELEKPQVKYLKSLLYLPRNTPNYIVRKETGMSKMGQEIIKRAINWLINIKEMEEKRLPKICFLKLQEMAVANPTATKYNWVAQVRQIFTKLDCLEVYEAEDPKIIKVQVDSMIEKIQESNRMEDKRRIEVSSYSNVYKNLTNLDNQEEEKYLNMDVPLYKIRTIAQLRTSAQKIVRITIHKDIHVIETEKICTLCNLAKEESLEHFMLECPIYRATRQRYIGKYVNDYSQAHLKNLLLITSLEKINDIYNYTEISLKFRSNIINEYS
ncbi:hypothetical protein M8J77_021086 [Diaphorina citri]|nr:hypothetical protein M8J77_021086 [Diaphorina citri]